MCLKPQQVRPPGQNALFPAFLPLCAAGATWNRQLKSGSMLHQVERFGGLRENTFEKPRLLLLRPTGKWQLRQAYRHERHGRMGTQVKPRNWEGRSFVAPPSTGTISNQGWGASRLNRAEIGLPFGRERSSGLVLSSILAAAAFKGHSNRLPAPISPVSPVFFLLLKLEKKTLPTTNRE